MKFKMAENSLFAMLLRSPWWVSLLLAALLVLVLSAVLPRDLRVVGALSCLPFVVISVIAAQRQWRLPSAAEVQRTTEAVAGMAWPAFADVLERAWQDQGYTVARSNAPSHDFELAREGKRTLVSARRWKSARIGVDALRPLQAAREALDISDAMHIGLGELSDSARSFAKEHRLTVWQAADLAQALRRQDLNPPKAR